MSALVTVLCSTAISSRFCLHRETSIPTVSTKRLMKPLLLEVPCKLTSVTQGSAVTWRSPVRPALLPGHRMGAECGQQQQQTRPENVWGNWKMHLQKWRFNLQSSTFDHQNWDLITKMKIQSSKRCFNQPKSFHIIPLDFTYLKCLKMRIWLDESYPPWLPWDQSDMPNHRNWTTSSVNFCTS